MTTTDTSEKGLESLIVAAMSGTSGLFPEAGVLRDAPVPFGGTGWIAGNPQDSEREYAVDLAQLSAFLMDTQKAPAGSLDLGRDSPTRRKFLARLQGEITK